MRRVAAVGCRRAAPAGVRWNSTTRFSHDDFPAVLPGTDEENLMDFDADPMMRHERFNRDLRINSKHEGRVTRAQAKILEDRLDRQMEGRIRAEEIAQAIRSRKQAVMDAMREDMLVGDEIPPSVGKVTITHIGTLDGFDEEVPEVVLPRRRALEHQEELGMALCMVDISEDCDHAICRMRHLNAWLERQARTKIAYHTAQQQQNVDRVQRVMTIEVRANIERVDLDKKAELVCSMLNAGHQVRVTARNCMTCRDSAELLHYFTTAVYDTSFGSEADKPYVKFFVGRPMFSVFAASCLLSPMSLEGAGVTQLLDEESLLELADAVQLMRDEEFERDAKAEGPTRRAALEESRRRMFYGAQENFLMSKMRDDDRIVRGESWTLPITNHDVQMLEYNNEMRAAGQEQIPATAVDAEDMAGEHNWEKPEDTHIGMVGDPKKTVELTPGPDGVPRQLPDVDTYVIR